MPQGRRRGSRTSQLTPRSKARAELKEKLAVLRSVGPGPLKVLTVAQLTEAANAMAKTQFGPDAVIFSQDTMQTEAIVILDGFAEVKRVLKSTGEERKIMELEPGDTFGENVLMKPSVQDSSLIAKGWCVILTLEHDKYIELFGDQTQAVQQLLDENSEKMRLLALDARAAEDAAKERAKKYNLQHKSYEKMTAEERAQTSEEQRKAFKWQDIQPEHESALAMRLGPTHFLEKESSRPKFCPGQRVIYRTQLLNLGSGKGQEVAGNVSAREDGGRTSKRAGARYRVWFRLDNIVYQELKMEHELEDADENKRRKMMDFVLKMTQTRRYAAFRKWWQATLDWREDAHEHAMAVKLQTCFRMFKGKLEALMVKKTRLQMGRLRRKQRRLEAMERRLKNREDWELQYAKEAGYTLDGKRFFKTSKELRDWCDKATQFIESWERLLHRDDKDKRTRAIRRWRNNTIKLRIAEENRVLKPLDTYEKANELVAANPFPKVVSEVFSPSQWHPALGLRLPPLPQYSGTEFKLNGEVKITDMNRYRRFKESINGSLDCGNWLIPPKVYIGGFPHGQARRKGNVIRARGDCISVLLMQSITAFVCLMEPDELEDAKQKYNCDFAAELAKKHGYLMGQLKQGLENAKRAYDRALDLFQKTMGYADDYRQPYIDKKEKMEMIYVSQKKRWDEFPKQVQLLQFPMPSNANKLVPDEDLLQFVQRLEKLMRDGVNMYIFSAHGHGRVGIVGGCLLGRMYGLHPDEVLTRLQRYHDCRPGMKAEAAAKAAKWQQAADRHLAGGELPILDAKDKVVKASVIPACPYNLLQSSQIRRVLEKTESQYHGISKTTRLGAFDESVTRRQRNKGVPKRLEDGLGLQIVRVPRTQQLL